MVSSQAVWDTGQWQVSVDTKIKLPVPQNPRNYWPVVSLSQFKWRSCVRQSFRLEKMLKKKGRSGNNKDNGIMET
jgi:hypothetical protein